MPYSSPSSSSQSATYRLSGTGPLASAPPQDPKNASFVVTFTGDGNTDEATLDGVVQDFIDFVNTSSDFSISSGEKSYGTSQSITPTP